MEISHNLKSVELQTLNYEDIDRTGAGQSSIYKYVGAMTMQWAAFEFSLTGLLIFHSGMPPKNGYLMIGRMSAKSKYDKIISIMKANNYEQDIVKFMTKCRKQSLVPCEIRNTISHCSYMGSSTTKSDTFFFGGTRLPEKLGTILAYEINSAQIMKVAQFAQQMAIMNNDIAIKLHEAN